MLYSENAKKAQLAIEKFRETSQDSSQTWLGITAKNVENAAHETNNPFAFSDGTEIDESSFVWSWGEYEPDYNDGQGNLKCVYLNTQNEMMATDECDWQSITLFAVLKRTVWTRALNLNVPAQTCRC